MDPVQDVVAAMGYVEFKSWTNLKVPFYKAEIPNDGKHNVYSHYCFTFYLIPYFLWA